jgi:hypothetical protein
MAKGKRAYTWIQAHNARRRQILLANRKWEGAVWWPEILAVEEGHEWLLLTRHYSY